MKIIQNPDTPYALKVKTKLKENDGYCPCRLEKNEDTKCMCKEFREQISRGEDGMCHCGLYIATPDDEVVDKFNEVGNINPITKNEVNKICSL